MCAWVSGFSEDTTNGGDAMKQQCEEIPLDCEALITPVVESDEGDNSELQIRYTSDVLEFYLNGKKIFSGDWSGNFEPLFKRALKLWGTKMEVTP